MLTANTNPADPAADPNYNRRFAGQTSVGFGITQVVIGGICIIASIIALAGGCPRDDAKDAGCGIWTGAFYVVTGIIAIAAGKTRRNAMIVACMVLSIIAACMCILTLSFGASSVDQARDETYFFIYEECNGSEKSVSIAMGVILVIAALLEATVAIIVSALCCSAACCCNYSTPGQVYQPNLGQHYATGVTVIHTSAANNTTGPVAACLPATNTTQHGQMNMGYPTNTGYPTGPGPMPPAYTDFVGETAKPPPYNPQAM